MKLSKRSVRTSLTRRRSDFMTGTRFVLDSMGPGEVVAYLGWLGRGNVGDESMYEMHRHESALRISAYPPDFFRDYSAISRGRARAILLGGGTVVGRTDWLPRIRNMIEKFPDVPKFAIGVGVEDPTFQGKKQCTSRDALVAWSEILRRFDAVTVRGPLSQSILSDVGLDVDVSGDPALMEGRIEKRQGATSPCLGVNIPVVEDSWSGSMDRYRNAVNSLISRKLAQGWRIKLLSMTPDDLLEAQRISRTQRGAQVVPLAGVGGIRSAINSCDVVLGPRLHLSILAAGLGVPAVSVKYRPKCDDFLKSVGAESLGVSSSDVGVDLLTEMMDHAMDGYQQNVGDQVASSVAMYRQRLQEQHRNMEGVVGRLRCGS